MGIKIDEEGVILKYIKYLISTSVIVSVILYFSNIAKDISLFVMHISMALQCTIIFWEFYKDNRKKEATLNAVAALLFWVVVFMDLCNS